MKLAQAVREARKESGESLRSFAKKADLSQTYIASIESGKTTNLTLGALKNLAAASGESLGSFLQKIDELPPDYGADDRKNRESDQPDPGSNLFSSFSEPVLSAPGLPREESARQLDRTDGLERAECSALRLESPMEMPDRFRALPLHTGEKIRRLRRKHGWTQLELARKMGYSSKTTITRTEAGDFALTQDRLQQYAKIFNVPVSALLEDEKTPDQWEQSVEQIEAFRQDEPVLQAFLNLSRTDEGREILMRLDSFNDEEKERLLGILKLIKPDASGQKPLPGTAKSKQTDSADERRF